MKVYSYKAGNIKDLGKFRLWIERRVVWILWDKVDRPVHAEAVESTGTGVAAERGALEAESGLTMKPNWAGNWVGPASRRRDNIGAPAMQASPLTLTHKVQTKQWRLLAS